jgi:hypothetical protein
MQDRVAVIADHVDGGAFDPHPAQIGEHRLAMDGGELVLQRRKLRRPLPALGDGARFGEPLGDPRPRRCRIRLAEEQPAFGPLLAVRAEHGDVDAVHRGAAHHAECRQEFRHGWFSARSPAGASAVSIML